MRPKTLAIRTGARLADLIFPRTCAACSAAISPEGPELCRACASDLMLTVGGVYCRTCGSDRSPHLMIDGRCTACRQGKAGPRFDRFVRVGRYAGALRMLILRFKREFVLEKMLGQLLGEAIQCQFDPKEADLWVPVPAHWRRRLAKGFQPTALLTARAVSRWRAQVAPDLVMTRYVPPLHAAMTPGQRAEAVRGAFKVRRGARLAGRTVCLVDDVTTTGATLAEAKRALWEAGARRIFAAVLAKTSRVVPASLLANSLETASTPSSRGDVVDAPPHQEGLDRDLSPA